MTSGPAAVIETTRRLAAGGIESAASEARTLVGFATGARPGRLDLIDGLDEEQESTLETAITDRLTGKPLQHITGAAHFRTVSVQVGPGVFIPRPETESLAGWAIAQVSAGYRRIVELCAGSGAISLAIEAESQTAQRSKWTPESSPCPVEPTGLPPGTVPGGNWNRPRWQPEPSPCPAGPTQWAVESDDQAFGYLVRNLAGTSIIAVHDDMAGAWSRDIGQVDLVVANPPYIPLHHRGSLPPDVACDPPQALFSGADGLDAIRTVASVAARILGRGGVVGCEHGDDQGEHVSEIFVQAGFTAVTINADLAGRPRFVTATFTGVE